MPKLPQLRAREIHHILQKAGFIFDRQKGSHRMYIKGARGVTIPWHNKPLRKGTLRAIIRQSRLSVEDFLNLQ